MPQILTWRALLEIFLLALMIYPILAFLRGSRGAGIVRGVGTVLGIGVIVSLTLAQHLQLHVLNWLIENTVAVLFTALLIIFQPELRSVLMRVGQNPVFTRFFRERWDPSEQITQAVMKLSQQRIGGLIAIQRSVGLKTYTEGGVRLDAEVSAPLLLNIFEKHSPLHDGGVVIRDNRIVSAACIFPLSENPNLDPSFGTRHRAAVGISEETDALVIVVSEETGIVSVIRNGVIVRNVDEQMLRSKLRDLSSEEGFATAPVEEMG